MLDINITWIFPDLPVGEYEIVIAQKVGSRTLLNAYVHQPEYTNLENNTWPLNKVMMK